MTTAPNQELTVPVLQPLPSLLHCMFEDCGNEWRPRTDHMPKVCPRCKRYNWQTGNKRKRKGGRKHVTAKSGIGPATDQFMKTQSTQPK